MKIVQFSHFFVVCGVSSNIERDVVRRHCIPLVHRESHKNPHGEIVYSDPVKYFYYNKERGECHFHINSLSEFLRLAEQYGITREMIEFEIKPLYQPASACIPMHPAYTPKEKQIPVINYFMQVEPRIKLCTLQTGQGKDIRNCEPILTPTGWITHGEIKVGDQVICPDQTTATVVGVYPQGLRQLYRVTCLDGRTIDCSASHLWKIYSAEHPEGIVVTTTQLKDMVVNDRVYLPLTAPTPGCEEALDPQLIIYTADFSVNIELTNILTTPSGAVTYPAPLINECSHLTDRSLFCKAIFRQLGQELNQGQYELRLRNAHLARVLQKIIWSLGDICQLTQLASGITRLVVTTEVYGQYNQDEEMSINVRNERLRLEVVAIDMGDKDYTTCIAIDHPEHLYITTNFVVTHNTFSYLYAISQWGVRSMMVVRPQYFDTWMIALLDPIKRVTLMESDRILTIQGSDQLKKAIAQGLAGTFDYDFILMANRTLFNMNKVYEETGSTVDSYGCEPWELPEVLKLGNVGKDEGHMDFHANYRLDLFLHTLMSITLTATFDTDKSHNAKMQLIQHPKESRAPDMGYIKYIRVIGYRYSLSKDYELRYKLRGRSDYNHNQFEESILKNKKARKNYLGLILEAVKIFYVNRRTDAPQKCLILCGRVEMVETIVEFINETFDEVLAARYVSGDSLPEAIKADIIVTTIISGKAAIDIPKLITNINTVNVGSKDTNEQALGRTRELKDYPDLDPMFVYFYTEDIPSAYRYHLNKKGIFIDKVLSMDTKESGFTI